MTTTPNTPTLLPCPFCGRVPEITDRADNHTETNHIWFIACFCDGAAARAHQWGSTRDSVIEKWNTRHLTQPVNVPPGYRVVPEEPTPEMRMAGMNAHHHADEVARVELNHGFQWRVNRAEHVYKQMLLASPKVERAQIKNWDDFWKHVRETGWNPTADEMREHLLSTPPPKEPSVEQIRYAPIHLVGNHVGNVQVRFVSRQHLKDKPTEANPTPIRVVAVGDLERIVPPATPHGVTSHKGTGEK